MEACDSACYWSNGQTMKINKWILGTTVTASGFGSSNKLATNMSS